MVTLFNPDVVESCSRTWEWTLPKELWRRSPYEDWFSRLAEDRIRCVFRLGLKDRLPLVRQNTLRTYHTYIAAALSFPFRASLCDEMEPLVLDGSVIATNLCDPARVPLDSMQGILCQVIFRNKARLPLALLKLDPWDPNCRVIDDYWYWFWNCR
jgi:hypothetical protein